MSSSETIALIKPLGGIAGDMFAGACAALWPDLMQPCLEDVRAVVPQGSVEVSFETASANGFAAKRFVVGGTGGPATGTYSNIAALIERAPVEDCVRQTALSILRILGDAEAHVHGKPLAEVHFHELADWDSIADIVAAASFIARAPVQRWYADPLPLGGGTVATQHGRITVPAPAVLTILEGYDFTHDGVTGERVTPTGAAILRYLADPGAARVQGKLLGSGFGAGTRTFPGLANVVQLVVFSEIGARSEPIVEIAFDIDDMTPEELGVAVERLRSCDGVMDVTQTPQIGKKSRAIFLIRVLCAPHAAENLVQACLTETSTLGVRFSAMNRRILDRSHVTGRDVPVKVAARPGGATTAKAESDSLLPVNSLRERRAKAHAAEVAALESAGNGDD